MSDAYNNWLKNKIAEAIIPTRPFSSCCRASVHKSKKLADALNRESDDSAKLQKRVLILTTVIALVAIAQPVASGWPYLAWWVQHKFPF